MIQITRVFWYKAFLRVMQWDSMTSFSFGQQFSEKLDFVANFDNIFRKKQEMLTSFFFEPQSRRGTQRFVEFILRFLGDFAVRKKMKNEV